MEEIDKLTKRVDYIQQIDIKDLQGKVGNIEIELTKNSLLIDTNTKAMEKISNTMDKISETMVQLSKEIERSNRISDELSEKVGNLENKFDTLEDKTKFDIMSFIKQNWISIIVDVGVIAYLLIK